MQKYIIRKEAEINAAKDKVWRVLLTPELFTKWANAFCPDSKMKADWKKGGSVTYTDNTGMGLKGTVEEFEPSNRVTVKYDSVLKEFKDAPDEEGWKGCREIYQLKDKNGTTYLSIESETPTKEMYDEINAKWDQALVNIKELAEKA